MKEGNVMTLDQLRYFTSAATLLHFGKAAIQEHISQPSLSISIKKLEKELNVPLFQTTGRNVILTVYGTEFLQYARSILQQVEIAQGRMQEQSKQLNTEINIGYTAPLAYRYMPQLLKEFSDWQPNKYLIYSDEMPSEEIVTGLKESRFDFGICSKVAEDADITQIPIFFQPFVLITPNTDIWEHFSPLSIAELCHIPFISYRRDYPMYKSVESLFKQEHLSPHISHLSYSEDAIARLVEQELGISIVAHTDSLPQFKVRILHPQWLTGGRYIYLTYHRHRYHGIAVQQMIDFVLSKHTITTPSSPGVLA